MNTQTQDHNEKIQDTRQADRIEWNVSDEEFFLRQQLTASSR